ncbi:MAG: plasmid pRiA4b ORF-3 family protein [Saprospiraceae bacterium]
MSKILEIDIELHRSKPKIWRRVLVPDSMTFHKLHYTIQFAMGWTNSHLHQFALGKNERTIGIPHEDDFSKVEDSRKIKINSLLKAPKDKILYEYDFGDGWEHIVELKKVHEPENGKRYPVLIGGAMACPPEDCGGIWGYQSLVKTMAKKNSKEYKELVEWLGGEFDPEKFDPKEINEAFFKNFEQEMEEWDQFAGF